jgi:para-nitrobenzyl esterase
MFALRHRDGRMGIQEIALAPRFVREHIAAFGGDPDRVTVMGWSAGGGAIMRLLDDPSMEGLFHRVIVQSASARPCLERAGARRGRRFAPLLDIDPDAQDAGEKPRRMPAVPAIAKQMVLAGELSSFGAAVPTFTPCADEGRPFNPSYPRDPRQEPRQAVVRTGQA